MNAYTQTFRPATALSNFHDYDYENWSEKLDARNAALESFQEDWTVDLVSDERGQVFTKIDEVMADCMDGICCDDRRCEQLNRLLFSVWAGGTDCVKKLRELLDEEMNRVMEHEYDCGTDR